MTIEELKGEIKKIMILTTAFVALSSASGCIAKTPESYPEGYRYIDYLDKKNLKVFEKITKEITSNKESEIVYNSDNIFITIDKDTYEKNVYIYYEEGRFKRTYDFESGYLLTEWPTSAIRYNSMTSNDDMIHQNKYEAFLNELNSHPKSYYTKEEIYALADLFSEAIKQSNEQSVMSYSFK